MTTAQQKPKRLSNISRYVYLKTVHANTALINGKIVYDGKEWEKEQFKTLFPAPRLRSARVQIDSRQV